MHYNKYITNKDPQMSKALFVDTVYERAHKLAQALQLDYDKHGYSDTVFDIKEGRKYIKIMMVNNQESVHAFIDAKTGDVFKPASWRGPAKHVRYNLLDDASYATCIANASWAGGYLYMR
tara:strand:+ start:490 stop:849 length:360 start_codon:yes stop_codon:yes gene_type:complete